MKPTNTLTSKRARELAGLCHQMYGAMKPPQRPQDQAKKAARAAGTKKYMGSACIHKHSGLRYTSTGNCVECNEMHRVNNRKIKEKR